MSTAEAAVNKKSVRPPYIPWKTFTNFVAKFKDSESCRYPTVKERHRKSITIGRLAVRKLDRIDTASNCQGQLIVTEHRHAESLTNGSNRLQNSLVYF